MVEPHWLALAVSAAALVYVFEFYLDVRQSRFLRETTRPLRLQCFISEQTFARIRAFMLLRLNFSRVETTVGLVLEAVALITGVPVLVWHASGLALELFGMARSGFPITRGLLFVFLISVVSSVAKLPSEVYRVLEVDGKYARDKRKLLGDWASEQLVLFVLSVALGIPLLGMLLYLFHANISGQWLIVWVFLCAMSAFLSDVYPYFVGFWFSEYVSLPPGALRDAIEDAAEKVDYHSVEIFTVDAGQWRGDDNAVVIGLSETKYICLSSDLVEKLTVEETTAILMHEFGHKKLNHSLKHFVVQVLSIGVFVYLFSLVLGHDAFFQSFGFARSEPAVGLVLFAYLYGSLAHVLSLFTNVMLHHFEYSCDKYALERGQHQLDTSLVKLHLSRLANLVSDPLYALYHSAHPPLVDRLRRIDQIKRLLDAKPRKRAAKRTAVETGPGGAGSEPAAAPAQPAPASPTLPAYETLPSPPALRSEDGPAQSLTFRLRTNPQTKPVHIRRRSGVD